jgi:hypothetical protein
MSEVKKETFDEWWTRSGRNFRPNATDATLAHKEYAAVAWRAATAQSANYIADDEVTPGVVEFANGRIVEISTNDQGDAFLTVGLRD